MPAPADSWALRRVIAVLTEYAPDGIEFVEKVHDADLVVGQVE